MPNVKKLLISGMIAGPFFLAAAFIEGIARSGYSLSRDPISSLSIGQYGWMQRTNFWVTGVLFLLFTYGLKLRLKKSSKSSFWGPFLLLLAGLGFIGAGFFTTDPLPGYPTDLPYNLLPHTVHGDLHNFVSSFFFFGMPAAMFVFTRYFLKIHKRPWAIYSLLSGIGALAAFTATSIAITGAIKPDRVAGSGGIVGLLEWLTVIIILQWVTMLAGYMFKAIPSKA